MKNNNTITTMQTAMIVNLAYHEKGRGLGELLPLQVTKKFFQESCVVVAWQSYHNRILSDLVLFGWLNEFVAERGTVYYSLTPAGRNHADDVIDRANRHTFAFVPQTETLFDLLG